MGIYSEINLFKPRDGVFVPGETVPGVIKYSVDEPTEFKKITVSLKGIGFLRVLDKSRRRKRGNARSVYRARETYIDDDSIQEYDGNVTPIGSYEMRFNFNLPRGIPSSLEYSKSIVRYKIRCHIRYYVRIKFERPGLFSFSKHFRKPITVASGITPRLPIVPIIYGEQKKLIQLFSCKSSVVDIKANIHNSIITPGGKIKLEYEVINNTNVRIISVEVKLIEEYTFKPTGHNYVKAHEIVHDTDSKSGSISAGAVHTMPIEINIPNEVSSIEDAIIVKRDYFVIITVHLPMPHCNGHLKIPTQIGYAQRVMTYDDQPPSYWEAMEEGKKESSDDEGTNDENNEK